MGIKWIYQFQKAWNRRHACQPFLGHTLKRLQTRESIEYILWFSLRSFKVVIVQHDVPQRHQRKIETESLLYYVVLVYLAGPTVVPRVLGKAQISC